MNILFKPRESNNTLKWEINPYQPINFKEKSVEDWVESYCFSVRSKNTSQILEIWFRKSTGQLTSINLVSIDGVPIIKREIMFIYPTEMSFCYLDKKDLDRTDVKHNYLIREDVDLSVIYSDNVVNIISSSAINNLERNSLEEYKIDIARISENLYILHSKGEFIGFSIANLSQEQELHLNRFY